MMAGFSWRNLSFQVSYRTFFELARPGAVPLFLQVAISVCHEDESVTSVPGWGGGGGFFSSIRCVI